MGVQSTYQTNLNPFYEGQLTQERDKASVQSKICAESVGIHFGRQTFLADTAGKTVRLPHSTFASVAFTIDIASGDTVTANVVINGVTTTLTQAFTGGTHLATITALRAQIAALTGVATATVGGAGNRTITVTASPNYSIYFSSVSVSPTVNATTLVNTEAGIEYGPSINELQQPDSSGNVLFELGQAVGCGREAYVAMRSDATLNPGDPVYIRFIAGSGADQAVGMLTNAAGSNPTKAILSTTLSVTSTIAAGELGEVRINK